jgi:hypothetical protein
MPMEMTHRLTRSKSRALRVSLENNSQGLNISELRQIANDLFPSQQVEGPYTTTGSPDDLTTLNHECDLFSPPSAPDWHDDHPATTQDQQHVSIWTSACSSSVCTNVSPCIACRQAQHTHRPTALPDHEDVLPPQCADVNELFAAIIGELAVEEKETQSG